MNLHMTKLRVILWLLLILLPLATVGHGILLLLADTVLNLTFMLGYVILPLFTMLLLAFLVFSERAVWVKVILSIVLLAVFVLLFLTINFYGKMEQLMHYRNEDVEDNYFEIAGDTDPMPGLSEIGDPELLEYYKYFSIQAIFFDVDVRVLIGVYEEEEYRKQKALLEEKYVFQETAMTAHEYTCDPVVDMNGYIFRTLAMNGEYFSRYPKYMNFIATNDAVNEIVYMSYSDDDIDYITSLEGFIKDDCGWKYMR